MSCKTINFDSILSFIANNESKIKISSDLSSLEENNDKVTTMIDSSLDINIYGIDLYLFIYSEVNLLDFGNGYEVTGLDHNDQTVGMAFLNMDYKDTIAIEFDGESYTLDEAVENYHIRKCLLETALLKYSTATINSILRKIGLFNPVMS